MLNILITGATGFLGSAVAADILEQHADITPLFLVRAADAPTGLARLRESLHKLDLSPAALNRLGEQHILCGDLQNFASLTSDPRVTVLTEVLNCAAFASFAWKPEIWQVNVEHTSAFVREAARLPHIRRFLHVGTAMISGAAAHRVVTEDEVMDGRKQLVPYTRSKAEIEHRLPQLAGTMHLVVARPSIVVGHTRAGCKPSPSIFWFFRLIHAAGRVPFSPNNRIDIIPVDYCASALVHLLRKDTLQARTYHIAAGASQSRSFEQINRAYRQIKNDTLQALVSFDPANFTETEAALSEHFGKTGMDRIMGAVRVYQAFAGLDVCFNNTRLLAEGLPPPPAFTDYIEMCVRTGENDTITEQMKFDFR